MQAEGGEERLPLQHVNGGHHLIGFPPPAAASQPRSSVLRKSLLLACCVCVRAHTTNAARVSAALVRHRA